MTIQQLSVQIGYSVDAIDTVIQGIVFKGKSYKAVTDETGMTPYFVVHCLNWYIKNQEKTVYIEPLMYPNLTGTGTYTYENLSPAEKQIYNSKKKPLIEQNWLR